MFLPSHRSYLDPLVLRSVVTRLGLPLNYTLGGINVGFWPIGPVARRSGWVFIRRSIRGDEAYKLALRSYLDYLLRNRVNLEWYIEGGRSRTGKLRAPHYGVLSYLIDAFREDDSTDVYIVPVSIVYDQLYEVSTMAAEERGAVKQPESLGWLIRYARAQGRRFGKVHVRLGKPLSLSRALATGDRNGEPGVNAVEKVAFEVCHRINRATPIVATALVSLALLGAEDRALTLAEVRELLSPLLDYVERRALPTIGNVDLYGDDGVRAALEALAGYGAVSRFDGGLEPVWAIAPGRDLEIAFYRNSAIHFLVNRAIIELVLARVAEGPAPHLLAEAWKEALRLRDLLKFEFFFAAKEEFRLEIRAELALLDPDWEQRSLEPAEGQAILAGARPHLAHLVLRSFLEAYLVVAERLAAKPPGEIVAEQPFVAECRGIAQQYRLQGRLHSPESVSDELFGTAWRLAGNRGLVEAGGDHLAVRRAAFADELRTEVRRVETVAEMASRPAAT